LLRFCTTEGVPLSNWAILRGERFNAITEHHIDEGIETGPILVRPPVPIGPGDYAIDVLLRALPEFPRAILLPIDRLLGPELHPTPQNPEDGSYFGRRTPEEGIIEWKSETTVQILDKIRALADPYPGAFCCCGEEKIIMQRAEPLQTQGALATAPGRIVAPGDAPPGCRGCPRAGWVAAGPLCGR